MYRRERECRALIESNMTVNNPAVAISTCFSNKDLQLNGAEKRFIRRLAGDLTSSDSKSDIKTCCVG